MKKWQKGAACGLLKTEVLDENDQVIATVQTKKFQPGVTESGATKPWLEGEASLALILTAPALLGALEKIVDRENELTHRDRWDHFCRFCGAGAWLSAAITHDNGCPFQQARTAIAKAKGEQP